MRKLNGKLIVSALISMAVASMAAVSAGAISYAPTYAPITPTPSTSTITETKTTDTNGNTTTTTAGTSEAAPATVLTDSAVDQVLSAAAKSGADEVTLFMTETADSAAVQESAIAEIAKSDVVVTVDISSDDGVDYSVTIDPELIKEVKAVNLAMDITVGTDSGKKVSGVEVPAGSIVIAPAQKGDFGMTLQVTIPAAALDDVDLEEVALYYIADDGIVTKMPRNALRVNADGSLTVSISHASQYVVSDVDLTVEENIETLDDDDDDNDVDISIDGADENHGKSEIDVITNSGLSNEPDANPTTGVTIAFGALAASVTAVALTAKKRK